MLERCGTFHHKPKTPIDLLKSRPSADIICSRLTKQTSLNCNPNHDIRFFKVKIGNLVTFMLWHVCTTCRRFFLFLSLELVRDGRTGEIRNAACNDGRITEFEIVQSF